MSMQVTEGLQRRRLLNIFVKANGDTVVQNRGILTDVEIRKIQKFIKINYLTMYEKWSEYSKKGYYQG